MMRQRSIRTLAVLASLIAMILAVPPHAWAKHKAPATASKHKAAAVAKKKGPAGASKHKGGAHAANKKGHAAATKKHSKASAKREAALSDEKPAAKEQAPLPPAPEVIPNAVVNALADGDLNRAIIAMRGESPSPRMNYLLHEASTIVTGEMQKKPAKSEAHRTYQNIAIGYHNLYLFLKTQGINQLTYFKEAHRFYGKARRAGTLLHKSECDLLEATLLAAAGEREKAEKLVKKIDTASMRSDFESTEYLAAYRAASGDHAGALEALESAYRMNPERTLTWLAVGDDFADLKEDPTYQALIASWHVSRKNQDLKLSLPKAQEPKLDISGVEGGFAPQKMMVRLHKNEAAELRSQKGKHHARSKALSARGKKEKRSAAHGRSTASSGKGKSSKDRKQAAGKKAPKKGRRR